MLPLLIPIGLGLIGGYLSQDTQDKKYEEGGHVGDGVSTGQVSITYGGKTENFPAIYFMGKLEDIDTIDANKVSHPLFQYVEQKLFNYLDSTGSNSEISQMYDEGYLSKRGAIIEAIVTIADYMIENNISILNLDTEWDKIDIEGAAFQYEKGGRVLENTYEVEFSWNKEGDDDFDSRKVIVRAKDVAEANDKIMKRYSKYYNGLRVLEVELIDEAYKKGGKVKNKWIQKALGKGEGKGKLKQTARRQGLIKRKEEKLSQTDLNKLEKMGGKTAKRAYLAETLRKFKS